MEYFESKPLPTPQVVASAPREDDDGVGTLVLPEGVEGALLLKDGEDRAWRVSWERVTGRPVPEAVFPEDRRRALPPGTYTIVGQRLVDRSKQGEVWHTSATGHELGELQVEVGAELAVTLDPTVRIGKRASGRRVAMSVQGPHASGLSLYKDGRRIPIRYRLTDARGRELAEGPMTYG